MNGHPIDHVAIVVADLDAALDLYVNTLGFPVVYRETIAGMLDTPAIWAALRRRSPATRLYESPSRCTTIGWSRPCRRSTNPTAKAVA